MVEGSNPSRPTEEGGLEPVVTRYPKLVEIKARIDSGNPSAEYKLLTDFESNLLAARYYTGTPTITLGLSRGDTKLYGRFRHLPSGVQSHGKYLWHRCSAGGNDSRREDLSERVLLREV